MTHLFAPLLTISLTLPYASLLTCPRAATPSSPNTLTLLLQLSSVSPLRTRLPTPWRSHLFPRFPLFPRVPARCIGRKRDSRTIPCMTHPSSMWPYAERNSRESLRGNNMGSLREKELYRPTYIRCFRVLLFPRSHCADSANAVGGGECRTYMSGKCWDRSRLRELVTGFQGHEGA